MGFSVVHRQTEWFDELDRRAGAAAASAAAAGGVQRIDEEHTYKPERTVSSFHPMRLPTSLRTLQLTRYRVSINQKQNTIRSPPHERSHLNGALPPRLRRARREVPDGGELSPQGQGRRVGMARQRHLQAGTGYHVMSIPPITESHHRVRVGREGQKGVD